MHDLIIRGGTIYDGNGGKPYVADIAVDAGRISRIGVIEADSGPEIAAAGCIVTPGFVDAHSHLDGQVTWESRLVPNSGHGITTTIMGNCGVGFAPCRPEHREFTVALMEGVEDIPASILNAGLSWTWTSYPDYLQHLRQRQYDMNVGGLLPHSNLRTFVMGERAIAGEAATPADIDQMRDYAEEAVRAGALGVGSTRITAHKTLAGIHAPSYVSEEEEYLGIAEGIARAGRGILQIAPEFNHFPRATEELSMLIRVARRTGCAITFSLKQSNREKTGWRRLLDLAAAARDEGLKIRPQVLGRPTGAIITWECTFHPFVKCPSYREVAAYPMPERVVELAGSARRQAILEEHETALAHNPSRMDSHPHLIFPLGEVPNYEPEPAQSVAALAEQTQQSAAEFIYDTMMQDNGTGTLLFTSGNYADCSLEPALEMMKFDGAIWGLGDGGAHCTIICDASAPTTMLSYWSRDRQRGERLPLAKVVHGLTANIADFFGLKGRGRLAPDHIADINIIDYERLSLGRPVMTYDLPAGGKRLHQPASGYVATLVAGQPTVRHDQPTGILPGRLI